MAIQMRRGSNEYYNAAKMEAGEFASVSDTEKLYHSFTAGTAKEVAMMDDVEALVSEEIAGIEIPQPVVSHTELTERDAADQHPISAITGLQVALDGKQPTGNYLTSESDPTVPEWAKAATKPTYTAEEVHALPDTTVIPSLDGYATEEYVDNAIANSGVIVTASGESIVLTDSSDKPLEGLVLYGKTTQDGTPSQTNPIPLVNAGEGENITVNISDGTNGNNQTLTVQTPNGLPGVPVASGGNYTDENGQQWVCDKVDFENNEYVGNIYLEVFDGSADEVWLRQYPDSPLFEIAPAYNKKSIASLCTHFVHTQINSANSNVGFSVVSASTKIRFRPDDYQTLSLDDWKTRLSSSPVSVIYVLVEPIRLPLPAEEIAAYKALHTNKPVTTILNDGGAGISVSYVADTKAYIDNKFAALESAILSTGGNV